MFVRNPYAGLVDAGAGRIAFRTAAGLVLLEGENAENVRALWKLVDTPQPAADLARRAGIAEADVQSLLDALMEQGIIARALDTPPESALFAALPDVEPFVERLKAQRVRLLGNPTITDATCAHLEEWGVRKAEDGEDADVVVAAAAPGTAHVLREANARALADGMPALFAEWQGLSFVVGPTLRPGATACWRCADLRVQGNAEAPDVHEAERTGGALWAGGPPPAMAHLVASILAMEVARVALTGAGALEGTQLIVNAWDLTTERAPVLAVPGCPACHHTRAPATVAATRK